MATTRTRSGGRRAKPRRPAGRTASTHGDTLVYVYGVAGGRTAPATIRAAGLPNATPARAVAIGQRRWLIVADVPRRDFGGDALASGLSDLDWVGACAFAHDAVVTEALKAGPVVPMRLFTIFEDEARAKAHVRRASRRIERTLRRVSGRAEYGVRIALRRRAALAHGPAQPLTGRAFLEHKRARLAAQATPAEAPGERRRIARRLAAAADEVRHRPIPDGAAAVWLDDAFLVARRRTGAFEREVRRLAAELEQAGHEVVLTGPWPPYSFVDERGTRS